ncbi:hypothetical protein JOF46_001614 [Paeniglutamicibacter psychrophenolicus]|uniref:Uncharacterized protein n=1 Tax=Paeniglutamicibacter psychrophenolicus TaxID=257454 RepID=A0ABS4WBX9_9MICC|nr:hypothetical protein [Paeniglutamicibacter psychrophenolicus]
MTKKPTSGATKVERSSNALKQWRGMATRCALRALAYRPASVLHAVPIRSADIEKSPWGDTP